MEKELIIEDKPQLKLIKVYSQFDRSQRDTVIIDLPDGASLFEIRNANFPLDVEVIVSVNGRIVKTEELALTYLKNGDNVLFIPEITGGGGGNKNPLRMILMIVVAVVAAVASYGAATPFMVGGAMTMGSVAAGVAAATIVTMIGGFLINALLPPDTGPIHDYDSGPTYTWSPATTQEQGLVIPRWYGVNKIFGNVIAAHTENSGSIGEASYMNALICLGVGPIKGVDDEKINDEGYSTYYGVTTEHRLGAIDQDVITNFNNTITQYNKYLRIKCNTTWETGRAYVLNDSVSYEEGSYICVLAHSPSSAENAPGNAEYWSDMIQTTTGDSFDELEIEVTFPSGLWRLWSEGAMTKHTVRLSVMVAKVVAAGETEEWICLTDPDKPIGEDPGSIGYPGDGLGYWSCGFKDSDRPSFPDLNEYLDTSWFEANCHYQKQHTSSLTCGTHYTSEWADETPSPRTPISMDETVDCYWKWIGVEKVDEAKAADCEGVVPTEIEYPNCYSDITYNSMRSIKKSFKTPDLGNDDRAGKGQYKIRVTKLSADQEDLQHYGDYTYLTAIREIYYDDFKYPRLALTGVKALATDQLSGALKYSCLLYGSYICIPDTNSYDSHTESSPSYSGDIEYSTNPAWVCWDILTQPVYSGAPTSSNTSVGAGTAGTLAVIRYDGVEPTRLNWTDFKAWADHCDEEVIDKNGVVPLVDGERPSAYISTKRSTYNGGFDSQMTMWESALRVCNLARAMLIWNGTNLTVAIDKAQDSMQLFSVGNISKGSFKETFVSVGERASEVECDFMNQETGYDKDRFTVFNVDMDDDTGKYVITLDLTGIIYPQEVWRYAMYRLYQNQYLTKTIEFDADIDSIACTVGDVISVQHDTPNWLYGGRVVSATSGTVTLDKDVSAEGNLLIMVRVASQTTSSDDGYVDHIETVNISSVNGSVLTLEGSFSSIPAKYDLYGIGYQELSVKEFKVMSVTRTSDQNCKISAIEYNESIYNIDNENPVVPTPPYLPVESGPVTNLSLSELKKISKETGAVNINIGVYWKNPIPAGSDVGDGESYTPAGYSGYARFSNCQIWERNKSAAEGSTEDYGAWRLVGATVNSSVDEYEIQNVTRETTYEVGVLAVYSDGSFDIDAAPRATITISTGTYGDVLDVKGLQIKGRPGETEFITRDCEFVWKEVGTATDSTDSYAAGQEALGAGEYVPPTWFKHYLVKIFLDAAMTTLRRETTVSTAEYNYTYDKNKSDSNTVDDQDTNNTTTTEPPTSSFTIAVWAVSQGNEFSNRPATLDVSNLAPQTMIGLACTNEEATDLEFTWTQAPEVDIDSYELVIYDSDDLVTYRRHQNGITDTSWVYTNSLNKSDSSETPKIANQNLIVRGRVKDTFGNHSDWSGDLGVNVTYPPTPQNLRYYNSETWAGPDLMLQWDAITDYEDLNGYKIKVYESDGTTERGEEDHDFNEVWIYPEGQNEKDGKVSEVVVKVWGYSTYGTYSLIPASKTCTQQAVEDISNLRVCGSDPGAENIWYGADLRMCWNLSTQSEWSHFQIQIYNTSPYALRFPADDQDEEGRSKKNNFTYTLAQNGTDGLRLDSDCGDEINGCVEGSLTFKVRGVNRAGNTGNWGTLAVTHAVPHDVIRVTATAYMDAVMFHWVPNSDLDISHYQYRISVHESGGTKAWGDWIETTATNILRSLTEEEKLTTFAGLTVEMCVQVLAYNDFGSVSENAEEACALPSELYVAPTDIRDFGKLASDMFDVPVLDGVVWTGGSWNAHSLWFEGTEYEIASGSTTDTWIYWMNGATSYATSNDHPGDNGTLTPRQDFLIATYVDGYINPVWFAMANAVIGSAYIMDAAIGSAKIDDLAVTNAHINDLSAIKITTGILKSHNEENWFDLDNGAFHLGTGGTGDPWASYVDWNNYEANTLHIKGAIVQSPSGSSFPIPLYRGIWSASETYYTADLVSYSPNGNTYIGTVDIPVGGITGASTAPTVGDYWDLYSLSGETGDNAQSIRLSADGLIFTADGDGNYDPTTQEIDLTVALQSVSNSVSWTVTDYAGGTLPILSLPDNGACSNNICMQMESANFGGCTSATIQASVEGTDETLTDTVTIVKVSEGADAYTVVLSNEAHTFPATEAGVVDGGDYSGGDCLVTVYYGATQLTYGAGAGKYAVSHTESPTAAFNGAIASESSQAEFRVSYISSSLSYLKFQANLTITIYDTGLTIPKIISYTKSLKGNPGDDGSSGTSGSSGATGDDGEPGDAGPGVSFRGNWASGTYYYGRNYSTGFRADIVKYGSSYYICLLSNSGVAPTNTTYWSSFGSTFSSVATDILLAQDATITNALVMGTASEWGTIRSYNKTSYSSSSAGYWFASNGGTAHAIIGNTTRGMGFDGSTAQVYGDLIVNGNISAQNLARSFTASASSNTVTVNITFPTTTNRTFYLYVFGSSTAYSSQLFDTSFVYSGHGIDLTYSSGGLSYSWAGMAHYSGSFSSAYSGFSTTLRATSHNNTGFSNNFYGTIYLSSFIFVN
jgi:hypothetical protein